MHEHVMTELLGQLLGTEACYQKPQKYILILSVMCGQITHTSTLIDMKMCSY